MVLLPACLTGVFPSGGSMGKKFKDIVEVWMHYGPDEEPDRIRNS
ncbi:hypothetical protein LptCag_1855 [Leptospirillum ferriphilum]|uniref:Uncharacterized protein n=1 Tax=Leptospirillum ferriphilum TaxID=178606 RepID=A0A094W9I6_9BACT|nr:hypothetical protein LptCag_1855 [Leptospirillum ferriphilum]